MRVKDKGLAEELFGVVKDLDLYGELLRGRREDEGAEVATSKEGKRV